MRHTPQQARTCKHWWFDGWDWFVNRALKFCGQPTIQTPPGTIAADLHVHTFYSHCSIARPEDVILRAYKLGLSAIAVMDHHHVRGALETQRCAENLKEQGLLNETFLVIPGVELNSKTGHIGALFVTEDLPEKLSPQNTVELIHQAGGLAIAVHPYHSTGVGDAIFDAPFDAIEVECGSVFDAGLVRLNRALATNPRLAHAAKIGGSDAHYLNAIGNCYTVIHTSVVTTEMIRKSLNERKCEAHSSSCLQRMRRLLGLIPKLR
ncbi:MAG: PHP domain-containing protein [Armatimonadota bacterium]